MSNFPVGDEARRRAQAILRHRLMSVPDDVVGIVVDETLRVVEEQLVPILGPVGYAEAHALMDKPADE